MKTVQVLFWATKYQWITVHMLCWLTKHEWMTIHVLFWITENEGNTVKEIFWLNKYGWMTSSVVLIDKVDKVQMNVWTSVFYQLSSKYG